MSSSQVLAAGLELVRGNDRVDPSQAIRGHATEQIANANIGAAIGNNSAAAGRIRSKHDGGLDGGAPSRMPAGSLRYMSYRA